MRWNTVLFDLDGTVTDPKEGITCAVAYALRQQGIIADPDTLTSFIGPPLHESFPELFGLTEEQTDRAVEDFRAYFSRQGWAENIPYKGMAELLESLQGAGLKLVIATSKPEEFALRIMEHFGLAAYFHRICGAQREDRASAQKGSVVADALRRSGRLKKPRPAGLRSSDSAGLSPDNDAEVKAGDSFGGRPDDVAGMRPDESVAGRSDDAASAKPPVPPRSDHSDDM